MVIDAFNVPEESNGFLELDVGVKLANSIWDLAVSLLIKLDVTTFLHHDGLTINANVNKVSLKLDYNAYAMVLKLMVSAIVAHKNLIQNGMNTFVNVLLDTPN